MQNHALIITFTHIEFYNTIMKKLLLSIYFFLTTILLFAQDENLSNTSIAQYIELYKDLAMQEQMRVGIPASITLAQGIHESAASTSELATKASNHFGIKCKKDWSGETYLHDDDALQECFRKYPNATASYLDHSNYLKNNRRYSFLFDIPLDNYKEWAVGLRKAGYATNPKYSTRIITLVEKYDLAKYTQLAIKKQAKDAEEKVVAEEAYNKKATEEAQIIKTEKKIKQKKETVEDKLENTTNVITSEINGFAKKVKAAITKDDNEGKLNGLTGFYAKKGQLLLQEAVSRNIKYSKLLDMNDLDEEALPCDMFIYTEKKYKKSPTNRNHVVAANESMIAIAQAEGMQLKALRTLNLLEVGEEPEEGTRIYLQETVSRKPTLKKDNTVKTTMTSMENGAVKQSKKSDDVNISNQFFSKQDIEKQQKIDAKIIEENAAIDAKNINKKETENLAIAQQKLNEDAAKLNEEQKIKELAIKEAEDKKAIALAAAEVDVAARKEALLAEIEANKKLADLESAKIRAAEQDAIMAAEEEAKKIAAQEVSVIVSKPAPKSPTNYTEEGVSDELHKMKKIMDEIVYAAPPIPKASKPVVAKPIAPAAIKPAVKTTVAAPIKPAVSVPVKQTKTVPSVKQTTKTIPAKNPNEPTSKSTSPIITITKDEKKTAPKISAEKVKDKVKEDKKISDKKLEPKGKVIEKVEKEKKVAVKKTDKVPAEIKKEVKKALDNKVNDKLKSTKKEEKKGNK
jgi:Mannosyl-glycoprotein endo-beta-N-acetylglucosaminidase